MKINAVVILYMGKEPTQEQIEAIASTAVQSQLCMPEMLEIKHFDSDAVAKLLVDKSAADKLSSDNEKVEIVKVEELEGHDKLRAVKCLKEVLQVPLKTAKDMIDENTIRINLNVPSEKKIDLLCGLLKNGYALKNAPQYASSIFIRGNYGSDDRAHLITDYMDAREATSPTEKQRALINAVSEIAHMTPESYRNLGISDKIAKSCRDLHKFM